MLRNEYGRGSSILLCLGLSLLAESAGQDRELVVIGQLSFDEIRRDAHRLSVSEEQLINGRTALHRATALAPRAPLLNGVRELGSLWVHLDREGAEDVLVDLVQHLAEIAEKVENRNLYVGLWGVASMLVQSLKRLDVELSEALMEDFPEYNPGPGENPRVNHLPHDMHKRMYSATQNDPYHAVELLLETEESNINFSARQMLAHRFLGQGFAEEALALWDDTLDRLSGEIPNHRYVFGQVVPLTEQLLPERLPEVMQTWSRLLDTTTPARPAPRFNGFDLDMFHEIFSSDERDLISSLTNWMRRSPEAANRALDYFPEVRQKLDPFGGLSGLVRARRERAERQGMENQERILATHDALRADPDSLSERLWEAPDKEINQLLSDASTFYDNSLYEQEQGAQALKLAARLIFALEDLKRSERLCRRLVLAYLRHEGFLPKQVQKRAFELLKTIRLSLPGNQGAGNAPIVATARGEVLLVSASRHPGDTLEIVLLAGLAWEDFPRAQARIERLPYQQKLLTYQRFAKWVAGQGHNYNGQRFQ